MTSRLGSTDKWALAYARRDGPGQSEPKSWSRNDQQIFLLIVAELKCPVEGHGRIMFLGNFWDAKGPLDYPIELLASPTGFEPVLPP